MAHFCTNSRDKEENAFQNYDDLRNIVHVSGRVY